MLRRKSGSPLETAWELALIDAIACQTVGSKKNDAMAFLSSSTSRRASLGSGRLPHLPGSEIINLLVG